MDALTLKTASELDVLYGLYQLALDYTLKIKPEDESQISKWLDTRQRILGKTDVASKSAAELLRQFELKTGLSASERALIEEKKNMVKDLLAKLQRHEWGLMQKMHQRMGSIRRELAGITRQRNATRAYLNAPRAVGMLVA